MKRKIKLAAASTAALAMAGAAPASHAQSSVTLYGIIDAGVTYASNAGGAHLAKFDDGVSYGNRLGFSGSEDLGGGLKAVFALETGFRLGNGQLGFGGALFGRQAYVGLQNEWGTLSFGDQLDMTDEMVYLTNVSAWASGYAIHQGDFDRFNGDRLPNSVKFLSNPFGGFRLGAMYSFGNVAGNFHRNSAYSVGASYARGGFSAGAAYTQLNDPSGIYAFDPYAMIGTRTFLGQPTVRIDPASGARTDLFASTPMAIDKQGTFGAGASYAIGKLTLIGNLTYTTIKGFGQSSHMQVYEGGASYQFTPALSLVGGYQHTRFEGHHWNQGSAGLHYLLSKRTDVYLSGDYLRASRGVDAVIGYSFTPSTTPTQADLRIGMRHSF
ncbi:porin [Burkholderia glumae]|uniref:porin n=1 Tax=Burkholderia glumae TaxID=337 RepID=UPI0002FDAFC7|nr:porin [Burkholderia glumae]MCQ0030038.1 porin [Burkholderia glumae]MCQ0035575.1 porin [Burkholderia glumae]MCR1770253.1 porin [Burkholderia glumae]PJO22155.1 porin [Burkholderia glumae AU6208]QHE12612.1 porin [Burkholderia glumae AU6208]